jgi:ADP-ribosylglycohydrolase
MEKHLEKYMKSIFALLFLLIIQNLSFAQKTIQMSKEKLKDKIMGGWAGQTIGVTFGAPVEFKFNGTMINDYQKIPWYDGLLQKTMENNPGVYDDLYMDLTFVEVFEKEGLDAPVESHAKAYANAGYMLWHANQAARYNILHDILPPASGNWLNNPHADCIDYQIEADFAGLMSPGMPNTASKISDKIGHIMNYGDGWYGGVYIGAMYSLALQSKDMNFVVNEALKTIPKETQYYKCIADVIKWHKMYPDNWKKSWFELQQKWTNDKGCPDGVFAPFNIDATINSAYVVLGLLYGDGDFTQTMEITTRCGQDADCNPSSAGGILGAMLGYKAIPAFWKQGLKAIEDMDFKYTSTSLNDVYEIGTKHAIQNIIRNGGSVKGDMLTIKAQMPQSVHVEQSFEGHYPLDKKWVGKNLETEIELDFEGNGFVIKGDCRPKEGSSWDSKSDKFATVEVYIDGKFSENIELPVRFTTRRHEICWKYQLDDSKHVVKLILKKSDPDIICYLSELLWYSSKPQQQMTIRTYGPYKKK